MKKVLLLVIMMLTTFGMANAQWRDRDYRGDRSDRYRTYKTYTLYADGRTDDTEALNAWGRGERVFYRGRVLGDSLIGGRFLITWEVNFIKRGIFVANNTFVVRYSGYDSTDIVHFGRGVKYRNNRIVDEGNYRYRRDRNRYVFRFPF